jgi:hypothetical protein
VHFPGNFSSNLLCVRITCLERHAPTHPQEFRILNDYRQIGLFSDGYPHPGQPRNRSAGRACIALIWLLWAPGAALASPHIETDTTLATAGYYQLHWSAASTDVEVGESATPDAANPTIIYRGPDRARVISGKRNGTRFYRVREIRDGKDSAWSEPVKVTVAHHPLTRALAFFAVGAIVFLSTLALVVSGARRSS